MRINHNINALNAWRSMSETQYSMSKTLEKLSSGLRINRAGDDAAGLAISEKMRGQIRGLNMAVKNAQDAISLIQTAEGALTEVHSILQRMRELAVQAASDTNTNVDRNQIQAELDQLREEIDRIARTTEFNTMKLLDGKIESFRHNPDVKVVTGGNFNLQVSNTGIVRDTATATIAVNATLATQSGITIDHNETATFTLRLGTLDLAQASIRVVDADTTDADFAIQIRVDGTLVTQIVGTLTDNGSNQHSVNINGFKFLFTVSDSHSGSGTYAAQVTSFTVTLNTTITQASANVNVRANLVDVPEGSYVVEVGQFAGAETSALDVRVNFFDNTGLATQLITDFGAGSTYYITSNPTISAGALSFNSVTLNNASLSASTNNIRLTLTVSTSMILSTVDYTGIYFKWSTQNVYDINILGGALPNEEVVDSGVVRAEQRWYQDTSLIFQIGANEGHNMIAGLDDMRAAALALTEDSLKVTDQNSAERTIMVIDAAIHKVSTARAKLGAVQNRLEHTISNLGVAAENLTAAESRIRDADMAKEMMEFTKQQILMQSSMAMLAQSNALPQTVLQLLR